jgi:hypothetical protein
MKERRRVLRPVVEQVESRALLSGAMGASPVAAASSLRIIHLNGTIRGNYQINNPNPDVGITYVTNGSGHVHGVGHAFLTGKLHSIGFILRGHAQGELFLAGAKGTITLELTGVEQDNGPKGLPDVFSYTTAGGTGKYTHIQDSGTATLVTIPINSQANPQPLGHGKFTLVLTSHH